MIDKTLQTYVNTIPENRKQRFQSLYSLIVKLYPNAVVSMKYKMPTFEWQNNWVALANQKNYISLYTCAAQHLEQFKVQHPHIKTGTGCINFRDTNEIPLADLEKVIHSAMSMKKAKK